MKKIEHSPKKYIAFLCVFFAILLFPLATKTFNLEYHTSLYNVGISPKPAFSLSGYWNGTYQDNFDDYFSTNFGNYPALVKCYAQLRFNAFSVLGAHDVVLEDGTLIELGYLNNFLKTENSTIPTSIEFQSLYDQLGQIKKLLDAQGKDFILLIDPGKADYFSDQIPLRYQWRATYHTKDTVDLSASLISWAEDNAVAYVDGREISDQINSQGIPAFYNGGCHASKPVMFGITDELCNTFLEIGYNVN